MTKQTVGSDFAMTKEEKQWFLTNRRCPRDNPLQRLGYCSKIKKSCFSETGNGCDISVFPLLDIKSLQDASRIQEKPAGERLSEKLSEVASK